MFTDYCDRSAEIFRYAQLLHEKVITGRIVLKPRVSRPGAVEAFFAPTVFRCQFIPLIKEVSASLTIAHAKMDQLISLTKLLSSSHDAQLALTVASLAHKLQPEVVAISGFLQKVMGLSNQVLQEFSRYPQISRHVRALVSTQEYRLANLSMQLRDIMECNKAMMSSPNELEDGQIKSHNETTKPAPPISQRGAFQRNPVFDEPSRHQDPAVSSYQDQLLTMNGGPPEVHQQQMVVRQRDHATAIRATEATIIQLGEIYQQFSFLVKEQGEMVSRIDTSLEDAELNVDSAHVQLLGFMRQLSSRRAFMLKLFATLLLIFCVFALFKR